MLKKIGAVCGVFVLIVIAISLIAGPSDKKTESSNTSQNQTSEQTNQKPVSAIQKNDLQGFSKPTITKLSSGYIIASYLNSEANISVTVMDNGNLTSHDGGLYETDKSTITVDGVEVKVGYTTPSDLANPYASLAFDFKLGEFTYSGEVSHLGLDARESGDKQKLLDTFTQFMQSLKKEV